MCKGKNEKKIQPDASTIIFKTKTGLLLDVGLTTVLCQRWRLSQWVPEILQSRIWRILKTGIPPALQVHWLNLQIALFLISGRYSSITFFECLPQYFFTIHWHHASWCHSIHKWSSHQIHHAAQLMLSSWAPAISRDSPQNIRVGLFYLFILFIYYRQPCVATRRLCFATVYFFLFFLFFYSTFVLRNYSTDSHQIFRNCVF